MTAIRSPSGDAAKCHTGSLYGRGIPRSHRPLCASWNVISAGQRASATVLALTKQAPVTPALGLEITLRSLPDAASQTQASSVDSCALTSRVPSGENATVAQEPPPVNRQEPRRATAPGGSTSLAAWRVVGVPDAVAG